MSKVSQNKKVLIVDDDIDFLIQTETRLKNAGFEVL
ncbi:MAG: response regulator, partial [Candidatus Neomarinimicrobiota bacterium]